jgi:uncharacterized membrane protein YphA (DoxX/SURF4 family)
MATRAVPARLVELTLDDVRSTQPHRHLLVPRVVAAAPLLGIGLLHVFDPAAPMRPLVEAAGFPLPAVIAPVAVAAEIIAGVSLLLGFLGRIGGLIAIPTMAGAIYSHLVIGVWPNGAENEPPLVLPIAVLVAAAWVVWRGSGRWSLDFRATRDAGRGAA